MGNKTPLTISHNHIKIIGQKTQTPRTLNFINQFASEYQLVRQTQQYHNLNHKRRIIIQ